MKKILLFATVLFATALGFTACSDDDTETSSYNIASNAGAAVAQTYSGVWTRTLGDEVVTSAGTITLEGTEESHVVKVTIAANSDVALEESTFNANISQKSNTRFGITLAANFNAFLTTTGFRIIVDNGAIEGCDFIKSVKVGRKNNEYFYNFRSN
ncbi:MAG: hypothetical protein IJ533_04070 [Prevotella sp.]|nr:hypothetical protein [Prevotella sp.]